MHKHGLPIMPFLHLLLAVGSAAAWGFNFVFIKLGLQEIPPFLLCTLRFLLVSVPIVFFVPRPAIPFRQLAIYGLVNFAIQFSLLFWGIQEEMPAGLSSIILQVQMILSLIFAGIFLKERVTRMQLVGTLISFAGLAIVWTNLRQTASYFGFLLEIGGAAALAVGNLLTRKIGAVNPLALVAWGCLISTPPLAVLSFLIEGPDQIVSSLQHISWIGVLSIIYTAYVSTWFAYGVWSWLLGKYPVSSIIPFTLLTPIFGMFGAYFIFQEPLQTWKLNASFFILFGLGVHLFGPQIAAIFRQKTTQELPGSN